MGSKINVRAGAAYLCAAALIIWTGLASRAGTEDLPAFVSLHFGDALWAAMIYCGLRAIGPGKRMEWALLAAFVFCAAIELSQLYQADWLNTVRETTLGGLILGKGFLGADLIRYGVGILTAYMLDKLARAGTSQRLIAMLLSVHACIWILFPPAYDNRYEEYGLGWSGEFIGSSMMIMMALTLLLATRLRFLERLFGGLDRMYELHKHAGMAIFFLLLLHFLLIPLEPGRVPPGRAPGYIAFGGFLILILLSVAPRIPVLRRILRLGYRGWKRSHRFIGLFFIFGTAHTLLVEPLILTAPVPFALLMAAIVVGISSYLYTELIAWFARGRRVYRVSEVRRLHASASEVVLMPEGKELRYRAGQFLFIRFKGDKILSEWHPFTISSSPKENDLRLTIRASGDYTAYLGDHLKRGMKAIVEGGYGAMDYRQRGDSQIWIAGGIGITPFISWIRDMPERQDRSIDLFYLVRTKEEALFLEELLEYERRDERFRVHLHISADQGRLEAADIASLAGGNMTNQTIYMCGPASMMVTFHDEFRKMGASRKSIHYERFGFR